MSQWQLRGIDLEISAFIKKAYEGDTVEAEEELTAGEANQFLLELHKLITSSGQSLNGVDLSQISQAVARYASGGIYFEDSGATTNAFVLAGVDNFVMPKAYFKGMTCLFRAYLGNDGAATVNVGGLGVKNIVDEFGRTLAAGVITKGQFVALVYDGTQFVLPEGLNALKSRINSWQKKIFSTAGVSSFTVPAGVTKVAVIVIGGGGSGGATGDGSGGGVRGNPSGGGGGGGYAYKIVDDLTPGNNIVVTVGAGGVPNANLFSGGGQTSSFGTYVSATGGEGGQRGTSTGGISGQGGAGVGGDLNISGGRGGSTGFNTISFATQSQILSETGKPGFAAGGFSVKNSSLTGEPAKGYGSGGEGASGGNLLLGGAGANGLIMVEWG